MHILVLVPVVSRDGLACWLRRLEVVLQSRSQTLESPISLSCYCLFSSKCVLFIPDLIVSYFVNAHVLIESSFWEVLEGRWF